MGKPTPTFKQEIWSLKTADTYFSLFIRKRDGICQRCKNPDKALDCSHYWRRDMWGTRFDPDNCHGICRDCHTLWEHHQNLEYRAFVTARIGPRGYEKLEVKARTSMKRRDAILGCMKLLGKIS